MPKHRDSQHPNSKQDRLRRRAVVVDVLAETLWDLFAAQGVGEAQAPVGKAEAPSTPEPRAREVPG